MATTYVITDEIARALRDERKRLKRSQASTARAIGASQTTLQKIENAVMKESSFLRHLWLWLGLPAERFDQLQWKATGQGQSSALALRNGSELHAPPEPSSENMLPSIGTGLNDAQIGYLIRRVVWNDFTRVIGSRIVPLEQQIKSNQVAVALLRRDQLEARIVMTRDVAEQLALAILAVLHGDQSPA